MQMILFLFFFSASHLIGSFSSVQTGSSPPHRSPRPAVAADCLAAGCELSHVLICLLSFI